MIVAMALYDEVVDLARIYLGPAAKRFVDRQIKGHLEIESDRLTLSDLDELATWCYTSSKILMNDMKAREFSDRVKALSSSNGS